MQLNRRGRQAAPLCLSVFISVATSLPLPLQKHAQCATVLAQQGVFSTLTHCLPVMTGPRRSRCVSNNIILHSQHYSLWREMTGTRRSRCVSAAVSNKIILHSQHYTLPRLIEDNAGTSYYSLPHSHVGVQHLLCYAKRPCTQVQVSSSKLNY